MGEPTYYQKNMINAKINVRLMQEINTEIYLKTKKIKRGNMEEEYGIWNVE